MDELSQIGDEIDRFHEARDAYRAGVHQTLILMRTPAAGAAAGADVANVGPQFPLSPLCKNEADDQLANLLSEAQQKIEYITQLKNNGMLTND